MAQRGADALRALLRERLLDLRELDEVRFRAWLAPHLAHWRTQPAFLLREGIRDLRRAHPELRALEDERRRARAADESSPLRARLDAVQRELAGAENAVAGLTHALRSAGPAERPALREKLESFRHRAAELRDRERELTEGSPERLVLDRVSTRLRRVRRELGLEEMEARLSELQRAGGRSSGRSGRAFEQEAVAAVGEEVIPALHEGGGPPIEVLRGVSLGAARTEIDQLVVRPASDPTAPVEVLALVEAKRNPNDLAHGLRRRLENLAWLAGHREGYDPESYRTARFPAGHFEGMAAHAERGRRYHFSRESFRRFLPDLEAGALPAGLYLVTRPGELWGIGSAGMARIAHRVSSDDEWDPDAAPYLAGLLRWCQGLTHAVEAPDVLRRFLREGAAERVVLVAPG